MEGIFLDVLNRSIAAGWLILAVLAVRLVLKKAPRRLVCVLWVIVAVRLVCPFAIESVFSLIPSRETITLDEVRFAQSPAIDSGIPVLNEALNPALGERFSPEPGVSVNPLDVWTVAAGIVWIVGMLIMAGYALCGSLRIRAAVREAVPFKGCDAAEETLLSKRRGTVGEIVPTGRGSAAQANVLPQDNVWLCDRIKSPFILGSIRPRIYLPSGIAREHLLYVLAHEQAHIKRLDHCAKPFGWLLLSVYWFHPLVWAAYALFCRDLELACDEKVADGMDPDGRKAYSGALLACSLQRKMVFSYPLAFGEVGVRERVKHILHYRKPAAWITVAAILTGIVLAVCFLTDPKKEVDDEKIRYHDQWYSRRDLSEDTIAWLEWYNGLPEEEQLAVSSVPHDLYDLAGYCSEPAETVDAETDRAVAAGGTGERPADLAETLADTAELFDDFGIRLHLPDNDNWICVEEYRQPKENTVEVYYQDLIAEADCKLTAVRDGELDLSEPAAVIDMGRNETWQGSTGSGRIVYIQVQCSGDGKQVLATWEYDNGADLYRFAIQAEMSTEDADFASIPKAAISTISYLE